MNTGKRFSSKMFIEMPDDIWSLETLSQMIDSKTQGCNFQAVRPDFPDSEILRQESGGNVFSASCVAFRKMLGFSVEAIFTSLMKSPR